MKKRPFIFTNMATSLDGKIATFERCHTTLGTPYDRRMVDEIRSRADLVLVGSATLRATPTPMIIKSKELIAERRKKALPSQTISAVASSSLDLPPLSSPFFKNKEGGRWIFTTTEAAKSKKGVLLGGKAEIIDCGKTVSPAFIARYCQKRGIKNLLLEGGGALSFSFLKEGLIDEINMTLTPKLVGGADAPTMCDGAGFRLDEVVNATLVEYHLVEEEFYLRYSIRQT